MQALNKLVNKKTMYKQYLSNAIVKELRICKRLFTKMPRDEMDFKPKEGMRSTWELLQYLTVIGAAMPRYWFEEEDVDFSTFLGETINTSKKVLPEEFLAAMDAQIEVVNKLFDRLPEEDLNSREIAYPWGGTALLGEALVQTSVKWITAYKMQFFLYLKMSTDQPLGTPDAWLLTEISESLK
jgi:hypothetical protein